MIRAHLALASLATLASVAPAQGPGLGNLSYDASELFQPIAVLQHPNGYGAATMVDGWLMTVAIGDSAPQPKAIEFWDLSDPRNPQLAYQHTGTAISRLQSHTFGLSANSYGSNLVAFMASRGFQIWDVGDPAAVTMVSDVVLPNTSSQYGAIFWIFWQPPYMYIPGASSGLYVVRVDDPASPQLVRQIPPSQLSGIAPNQVFAVGNLMVLVRSKELGFATFDISDPENPVPLDFDQGARGYSHVFAAGVILTSGGDGGPVQMFVHDIDHAGQISFVGSVGSGFSNGAYGSYQDGYFHTGMSSAYAKFHVESLQLVGTATTGIGNRDEDIGRVLGNLAFVGDDHGVGSGLYVHDTQPDSNGPDVAWVHPADGATGIALTSRVGLSLSDSVDFLSVGPATLQVRPVGGAPVPGKYTVQMGLANFAPDAPLQPNTVYEVVVAGIEDLVGNSGTPFRSQFTTGNGLPSGPPVSNVTALTGKPYRTGSMAQGAVIYIDRDYRYGAIPSRFRNQPYILTANDDKFQTAASFLTFQVPATSRVCVLYDVRAAELPAWLNGWARTGERVGAAYDVYERQFPAGAVVLGGNAQAPMQGAQSNYGVVVIPDGIPPTATAPTVNATPVNVLVNVQIPAATGTPPFTYTWNFGDGTVTPPQSSPSASHVYTAPGRYPVVVTVSNAFGSTAHSALQIVHPPLAPRRPTRSSPIVHDGSTVACVNPDNDTVTGIDDGALAVSWETAVGDRPRTLAIAPDGSLWVVVQDDARIAVLRPTDGALLRSLRLPRGSQPYGIAFAPDGRAAYVTLQAGTPVAGGDAGDTRDRRRRGPRPLTGAPTRRADGDGEGLRPMVHLLALDPVSGAVVGRAVLDGAARGVAVTADSRRVLVTRFRSPHPETTGVVWEFDASDLRLLRTHRLAFDPGPDTERSGRGVPNYLTALTISPDGSRVVVPSKKDNTARGLFRDGQPLTFESRTRTIVSQIDLVAGREDLAARLDLNDRDMAQAAAFTPLGDLFAVALQGSNAVDVFDAASGAQYAGYPTGRAPQGLVFRPDGGRLYVHNFMSRSVTVLDTSALVAGATYNAAPLAEIATVGTEKLSPNERLGKRIFYNASDRRMNLDGYISCASCHLDGDSDGQTWDFTQTGEGVRNTIPLIGRGGMQHGFVHWTANFDEIQDFENDIREGFMGAGFLLDPDYAATRAPLGVPKAGLNLELDALSAYVWSLDTFPPSPHRQQNGELTADAVAGRRHFERLSCASCHSGTDYTDYTRHDVGTIQPSSGLGQGAPLPGVGIETPTLRGLWMSPPYLHNGQARSLLSVLNSAVHGGTDRLSAVERAQLAAYLLQIE